MASSSQYQFAFKDQTQDSVEQWSSPCTVLVTPKSGASFNFGSIIAGPPPSTGPCVIQTFLSPWTIKSHTAELRLTIKAFYDKQQCQLIKSSLKGQERVAGVQNVRSDIQARLFFHDGNLQCDEEGRYITVRKITAVDTEIIPGYSDNRLLELFAKSEQSIRKSEKQTDIDTGMPESVFDRDILVVTIYPFQAPQASGLFISNDYHSDLTKFRNVWQSPGIEQISFIFRGSSRFMGAKYTKLNDLMVAFRDDPPLQCYFPCGDRIHFAQQLPMQNRPNCGMPPAQTSFRSLLQYKAINAYGLIEAKEYVNKLNSRYPGKLRLIPVNGCGENRYLGALRVEGNKAVTEPIRLKQGDKITVNFDPKVNSRKDDWQGEVASGFHLAGMDEVTIFVDRPFDMTTMEWSEAGPNPKPIPLIQHTNLEDSKQLIRNAPQLPVTVGTVISDTVICRQWNAINKLTDMLKVESLSFKLPLLLGNAPASLRVVPLLPGVPQRVKDDWLGFCRGTLDDAQYEGIKKIMDKGLPGGLFLWEGGPGTGKTEILKRFVLMFAKNLENLHESIAAERVTLPNTNAQVPREHDSEAHTDLPKNNPVLLVTTTNTATDDLTNKVNRYLEEQLGRKPRVIRLHASETEKDFLLANATKHRREHLGGEPPVYNPETEENLAGIRGAELIMQHQEGYRSQYSNPYVKDRRFKDHLHALGMAMAKTSTLVPCDPSELPAPVERLEKKFGTFRELYHQWKQGADSGDTLQALTAEIDKLHRFVLQCADAVVCTVGGASDPKLAEDFQPHLIILDEAGRITETEFMTIMAMFHNCNRFLIIGDPHQLPPCGDFLNKKNRFKQQMQLSFLQRMILNGHPSQRLVENHRLPLDICDPIAVIYYDRLLVADPANDDIDIAQTFRAHIKEVFGVAKNSVLLDISTTARATTCRDSNMSSFNDHSAQATVYCFLQLLKIAKPAKIAVITPYDAQKKRLMKAFAAVCLTNDLRVTDIQVLVIDEVQGREFDYVILDLVVDGDSIGFLRSPNRCNVALSRAKGGQIIIAQVSNLENAGRWRRESLLKVFSEHQARRQYIEAPSVVFD